MVRKRRPGRPLPESAPKTDRMHYEGGAPLRGKMKGEPREITRPLTKKQRALIEENAPNIERLYGWVSQRVRRKVALEHAGYPKDLLDICRQQVNQTAMASSRTWRKDGGRTFASYLAEMRFAISAHAIRAYLALEKLKAAKSNLVTRMFLPERSQHRDERSTKAQERAQPTLAHVLSGESKGVARVLLAQLPKKEAEALRDWMPETRLAGDRFQALSLEV